LRWRGTRGSSRVGARNSAHMTRLGDGPGCIGRFANSSGVKSFIKRRICTRSGQIVLQTWHTTGLARSLIAFATAFGSCLFSAQARIVSVLSLLHEGSSRRIRDLQRRRGVPKSVPRAGAWDTRLGQLHRLTDGPPGRRVKKSIRALQAIRSRETLRPLSSVYPIARRNPSSKVGANSVRPLLPRG